MLEQYIAEIKPKVYEIFKNDSSGHDISHLERTMNLALKIQEAEGGDKIIIGVSAFLHDVHRIMQNETGVFVSPKDSLEKIKDILKKTDLSNNQIEKICFCIENHENYNWNGNNVDDINTLILQDADNIDAIGAIGIGRTFSYGGSHNVIMYDDTKSLEQDELYSENNVNDPSTIHHFYHKLFRLKDNMNTETARKIAIDRTDFMKKFVNQFLDEWKGLK